MNRFLSLIAAFILCLHVTAQTGETKRDSVSSNVFKTSLYIFHPNNDTIHVDLSKNNDLYSFTSGILYKRVSDNVLKFSSTQYKGRRLICKDRNITSYKLGWLDGNRNYLKSIDIAVRPTDQKAYMTITDSDNAPLSQIKLILSPKVKFFLKINNDMVEISSSTEWPTFKEEDDVSIVVIAENGKKMEVEEHLIVDYGSIGNVMRSYTIGAHLIAFDKKEIITRPMTNFGLSIVFGNGKGDKWKAYLLPIRNNN
ncbi:MAG: hypothetical protein IK017_04290 [Paludibacteraceae bacterium]|nr:hypothetical protein [Paludibacteraceae bacterium]